MSFYIRKSVKLGPVRLNFSKSGVGISSGVKGARISTGPRGTYINLGRNGIYYRHRIDNFVLDHHPPAHIPTKNNSETLINGIPTASAAELVDSSNKALLAQINSRIHQPTHAFQVGIVATLVAGALASISVVIPLDATIELGNSLNIQHPYVLAMILALSALILLVGLSMASATRQQETLGQITTLRYALDPEAKEKFLAFQRALTDLAKAKRIWQLTSSTPNTDLKRHAGATSSITRKQIVTGVTLPPFIRTGFNVQGLLLGAMKIFFLPDQILVFESRQYGAISYDSIQIHVESARFVERESVPSDSNVVDYTWQYVNKNGSPDKRFSNNRKLPIAQYGYVEFSSSSGLNLHFHVSNLMIAQQFAQALHVYGHKIQEPYRESSKQESYKSSDQQRKERLKAEQSKPVTKRETPFTILKIDPSASRDEVTAAYRKLAQMYHPDKVATLGPEFQELAEEHMKAINAAYEEIQRMFKT